MSEFHRWTSSDSLVDVLHHLEGGASGVYLANDARLQLVHQMAEDLAIPAANGRMKCQKHGEHEIERKNNRSMVRNNRAVLPNFSFICFLGI